MGRLSNLRNKQSQKKFIWGALSEKQLDVMSWWHQHPDKDIIIADGAVRSGKTVSMIASFLFWSMHNFNGYNFGICGKTIGSLRRNVITELKKIAVGEYLVEEIRNENLIIIAYRDKRTGLLISNNFYCFGGKDESSQDLVQGITLAGVLFDEIALMPQSFVNQTVARCSVEYSKVFANCNPSAPQHWFKQEWIEKRDEKKIHYLHFTMVDNLTLSDTVRERYESLFSGVFYDRYIKGLWVLAEGVIYDNFNASTMVFEQRPVGIVKSWIGVDYGTSNATTFLLVGLGEDNKVYVLDEYYHSGRDGIKKSPEQYEQALVDWLELVKIKHGVRQPEYIIIDPAANYFITQLWYSKKVDVKIRQADNKVIPGINLIQSLITTNNLLVHKDCKHLLREFGSYRWDEKAQAKGEDKPVKQDDHVMDALRYSIYTNKMQFLHILNLAV